jgi:hypothetical protein
MQAHDVLQRLREHAERVGLAQVFLRRERKFRQVIERLQVIRMHAGGLELGAIVRHALIDAPDGGLQALKLQCGNLVAAGARDV